VKNTVSRITYLLLSTILLISCGPSDMIWPSDRIGKMWVNRYGHTNAEFIWDHCDDTMTETPGIQTTECAVPWVDELFIGYGIRAVDKSQRDALWEARTWELYIDGHAVDLAAFNVADFDAEQEGKTIQFRLWRIRLREIPEGLHTLHYMMHVNQEVESDPASQSVGTYELVVNFTFGAKQ
jgi:hypothetical protein